MNTDKNQASDLVPLFAVAPKPSERYPDKAEAAENGKRPIVARTEFGWDCRFEDADLTGYSYHPDAPPSRNPLSAGSTLAIVGVVAAVFLLVISGLPGKIASALHGSPAAPVAAAQTTPTATISPPPTPPPSFTSLISPPTVNISGQGMTFNFRGSLNSVNGNTTTHCIQARTSVQTCSWQLSLSATTPLYMHLTGTKGAQIIVNVANADGHQVTSAQSSSGDLPLTLQTPPQTIIVTVMMQSTQSTDFDLAVSEHPLS